MCTADRGGRLYFGNRGDRFATRHGGDQPICSTSALERGLLRDTTTRPLNTNVTNESAVPNVKMNSLKISL